MHELGILMEVVKRVERFSKENGSQHIETLVLQIGEISSVIPEYMKKVYPIAVEGTCLEGVALEIEVIPAQARCQDCDAVFHATVTGGKCPACGNRNMKLISGREFMIKELRCVEESEETDASHADIASNDIQDPPNPQNPQNP